MSWRASLSLFCTALLIAALGAGGFLLIEEWGSGGPPLTPAPVSSEKARLLVGKLVHASKANETIPHQECVAAADPTNPKRLLVASMYSKGVSSKLTTTAGIAGYYSVDGGETWQLAFEHPGELKVNRADPALAFGPDGVAHFVCMRTNSKAWEGKPIKMGDPEAGGLEFARSPDGGKAWGPLTEIPPYIDRPWLAIDCTEGRFRGRLYCLYDAGTGWTCLTSPRGEPKTEQPKASFPKKPRMRFAQTSNLVVLGDGQIVCAQDQRGPDKKRRPQTTVMLSDDGGRTFREVGKVNTAWSDPRLTSAPPDSAKRTFFPQIAADTLGSTYRNRLYYVWEDGGEEARILFSASGDRGRTWTGPLVLSEQPAGERQDQDYLAFMPSIAVNEEGAVAVSWYDRRGLAAGTSGYNVRLRVSLDGGVSWLASVLLNEKTCQNSVGSLGDTAGLAADADGSFHPVWIDDRTGKRQVWTATVKVLKN
jgi:BNR/Asp-box repeat protein